jgi:hypothetical protein
MWMPRCWPSCGGTAAPLDERVATLPTNAPVWIDAAVDLDWLVTEGCGWAWRHLALRALRIAITPERATGQQPRAGAAMGDAGWIRFTMATGGWLLGCAGPEPSSATLKTANADCTIQVELHGGAVLASPMVVNVYWGGYWETPLVVDNAFLPAGTIPRQAWDAAWTEVAASPTLWAGLREYGVADGSWGGSGTLPALDVEPEPIPEAHIHAALEKAIGAGGVPERAGGIAVVYLAPGRTAAGDYTGFGGGLISAHHGSYRGAGGAIRVYAVVEPWNASMGGNSVAAAHEILEAASNPDGSGYWESASGNEIADLCVGFDVGLLNDASPAADFFYRVPEVWSQHGCACPGEAPRTP